MNRSVPYQINVPLDICTFSRGDWKEEFSFQENSLLTHRLVKLQEPGNDKEWM